MVGAAPGPGRCSQHDGSPFRLPAAVRGLAGHLRAAVDAEVTAAFNVDGVVGVSTAALSRRALRPPTPWAERSNAMDLRFG